jgi:hypothetical protein
MMAILCCGGKKAASVAHVQYTVYTECMRSHQLRKATLRCHTNSVHCVPGSLFFAAEQRIAITLSPNYYQKMQRFTTRKNQEEHGPDVMSLWRNHQKTIAVEKMSQTKPNVCVPLPYPPSQMASISGGFSTW